MGFYGNISNSNKSSFTFDKVYSTRKEMDQACDTDGIFLGRFVLVEYDISPIKGYYQDSAFYTDKQCKNLMIAVEGNYYQNLFETENNIYHYQSGVFTKITAENYDYGAHYKIDVETYGRGYDSTAWMKRYDAENHSFKYVMIAELNTVIPDFHLIVDPPEDEKEVANIPHFDEYSTNLNYYLHMPANFTHEIKKENITFNKDGFDKTKRSYIENPTNSIGYEKVQGTRGYLSHVYDTDAETAKDTYEWHITLEGIGNIVCELWDTLYGIERNSQIAMSLNDGASRKSTTLIGALNIIRDVLGYAIVPIDNNTPEEKTDADSNIYYLDEGATRTYYYYIKNADNNMYELTQLPGSEKYENSIYGLLTYLHTILGTGDPNTTDLNTVQGCINEMHELFSLKGGYLAPNSIMATDNNGKITTFGSGNGLLRDNSEKVLIEAGIWKDINSLQVSDPFDETPGAKRSLGLILEELGNRVLQGAGRYMGEDILDDLLDTEYDYNWDITDGKIFVNLIDGVETNYATNRDVDHSIYLAEKKVDLLYDLLMRDLVHHFELNLKTPVYQFDEDTFILTLLNEHTDEYNNEECSCIIRGLINNVEQEVELAIFNGSINLNPDQCGFDTITKITLRRTLALRSSGTVLTPLYTDVIIYEGE